MPWREWPQCSTRFQANVLVSDTFEMATFARDYAATNGPEDPVFTKYFGTDPKAFSAVIGIWEALLTSNKEGVLFRCDNPDGVRLLSRSPLFATVDVLKTNHGRTAVSPDGEAIGEVTMPPPRL